MDRPPSTGRYSPRVETRGLNEPTDPNGNLPASVPPATVGPDVYRPGEVGAVEVIDEGRGVPRGGPPGAAPWSGWPAEWSTPNWWGHLQTLTDTAWTCLDLNASLLATMPPYLVNASPTLPDDWLDNPDPAKYASWEEFAKQLFWDYQLGEAFVLCTARYANGFPARFHVVDPWYIDVEMLAGRRRYTIGRVDVTDDMLHIRYQGSASDAHGHGPLEAGSSRLLAASVLTRYGTNIATTGGIPNSVLKYPDELSASQAGDLQAQWVAARMSTLGLPAVLSGGVTFETLQYSPTDMALIDLLQFNESRIAVLLRVPPYLVGLPSGGDSLTYSTVSMALDFHWRAGLRPQAQAVTAALSSWLTPRGTRIEVNRDAYVQPEPLARAQTWQILIDIGVLTPEQVQVIERYSAGDTTVTGATFQEAAL
jgi:HK97 family phage portal protein